MENHDLVFLMILVTWGYGYKIMKSFSAIISKIGINPYVGLPEDVLDALLRQADKTKGPIQVCGTVNGKRFKQTLKTESSLERNIEKVIQHLLGEKPKGLHHLLEARD